MKKLTAVFALIASASASAGDRPAPLQEQINQLRTQVIRLNEKLKTNIELNEQLAGDYTFVQLKEWGASIGISITMSTSSHAPSPSEIKAIAPYAKECVTRFRAYYGQKAAVLTEVILRGWGYDMPFGVFKRDDGAGELDVNYWGTTPGNVDTCFNMLASTLIK